MLHLIGLSADKLGDPKYKRSQKKPFGSSKYCHFSSAVDSHQVCENVSKTNIPASKPSKLSAGARNSRGL